MQELGAEASCHGKEHDQAHPLSRVLQLLRLLVQRLAADRC